MEQLHVSNNHAMANLRRPALLALLMAVGISALAGIVTLRQGIISAARHDLKTRDLYWFEITGTKVPCSDWFDFGVKAVFQEYKEIKGTRGGRLCRSLGGRWAWLPD